MGCSWLLKLGLLSMLLNLELLFVAEAWAAVAASCCGSAIRAGFFLKTMLEAAEAGAALGC